MSHRCNSLRTLPAMTFLAVSAAMFVEPAMAQPADPAIVCIGTSGSETGKLVVMNTDGSNAAAIYSPPRGASLDTPTWSPDGTRVAFTVLGGSNAGLWRIDVAVVNGRPKGSNPICLVAYPSDGFAGWGPAWSPAGDQIAFYSVVGSLYRIESVPAAGGTPRVLYASSLSLHSPTWSPDASRIAFLERDAAYESFRIRLLEVATGVATTALGGDFSAQFCNGTGGGYKGLDWARTADVLSFSVGCALSTGDSAIYVLDLNGGSPVRVTGDAVQPTWSPDDARILFTDWASSRLSWIEVDTGVITQIGNKRGRAPDWRRS